MQNMLPSASPAVKALAQAGLLIACALILISMPGCGGGLTPQQKQAIKNLQNRGAKINFRGSGYEVLLRDTPAGDAEMQLVLEIGNVTALNIDQTQVTDEGVKLLEQVKTLELIRIANTKATPEGIASLRKALPKAFVDDE